MTVPTLRTARLILRPIAMTDVPRMVELAGSREVALNTKLIPHPYLPAQAEEWVKSQPQSLEQGHHNFAIDDGEYVGGIGLRVQAELDRAEIGYWLGVPYWGRGYVTEAVAEMIRYGFEDLQLNRIYAGYFARNAASGRVMEKNGMKYEGTLRQHVKKWDEYVDVVYYGILRSEWK